MNGTDQQRLKTCGTALPRIAQVFGMSPDAFLEAAICGKDAPASLISAVQASALLKEFMRIADPGARERCLDFVREIAARDVGGVA